MNEFEIDRKLKELRQKLSVRHLMVANNVLLGMTQTDAYLQVYKNTEPESAKVQASNLITKNNDVVQYIKLSKQKTIENTEINVDFIKKELLELYLNAKKIEIEGGKVYTKADIYIKMLGQTVVAFADKQISNNETIENILNSAIKQRLLSSNKQLSERI